MNQFKKVYASANEHVVKWSNSHYWVMYCAGMVLLLVAAFTWPILTVGMVMWEASNLHIIVATSFVLLLTFFGFKVCMTAVVRIAFAK